MFDSRHQLHASPDWMHHRPSPPTPMGPTISKRPKPPRPATPLVVVSRPRQRRVSSKVMVTLLLLISKQHKRRPGPFVLLVSSIQLRVESRETIRLPRRLPEESFQRGQPFRPIGRRKGRDGACERYSKWVLMMMITGRAARLTHLRMMPLAKEDELSPQSTMQLLQLTRRCHDPPWWSAATWCVKMGQHLVGKVNQISFMHKRPSSIVGLIYLN
jgi:hypothetical protein